LYKVVITAYRAITTLRMVMPDFHPNNSQIYLKCVLGEKKYQVTGFDRLSY
jgi:hypothetical protein